MKKSLEDIVKHQDVHDIVDFITDGNESDVSFLDDEDDDFGDDLDIGVINSFEEIGEQTVESEEEGDTVNFKELVARHSSPVLEDHSDVDEERSIEAFLRSGPRMSMRLSTLTSNSSALIANAPSPSASAPLSDPASGPESNSLTDRLTDLPSDVPTDQLIKQLSQHLSHRLLAHTVGADDAKQRMTPLSSKISPNPQGT